MLPLQIGVIQGHVGFDHFDKLRQLQPTGRSSEGGISGGKSVALCLGFFFLWRLYETPQRKWTDRVHISSSPKRLMTSRLVIRAWQTLVETA